MHIPTLTRPRAVAGTLMLLGLLSTACGGTHASSMLVRMAVEPAGAHCSAGGTALLTGPDTDGNGTLEDGEVLPEQTQYVCNGAALPYRSLVRVTAEPPGANCRLGGSRVSTGLDRNDDGTLADGEVDATQYVCGEQALGAVAFGDVTVSRADDLLALEGVAVLVGDLTLTDAAAAEVHLPVLQQVTGTLAVTLGTGAPVLTSLRLPALREVGALAMGATAGEGFLPPGGSSGDVLATVELPALERVHANLSVSGASALQHLALPALRTVGGELQVSGNASLLEVEAPALGQVGLAFSVSGCAVLAHVDVRALAHVGALWLSDVPALEGLALNALTAADGVYVTNTGLSALALPALCGPVSTVRVEGNAHLSTCTVLQLELDLVRRGFRGTFDSHDNLADEACAKNTADTCLPLPISGTTATYHVCYVARPFADARAECQALFPDGDLAQLGSAEEYAAVSAAFRDGAEQPAAVGHSVWLGYTDLASEGTFAWLDGSTNFLPRAGDTFWAPGEPNGGTAESCTELYSVRDNFSWAGRANDKSCTESRRLLCEVPPRS